MTKRCKHLGWRFEFFQINFPHFRGRLPGSFTLLWASGAMLEGDERRETLHRAWVEIKYDDNE
jgi:hypothetical protein